GPCGAKSGSACFVHPDSTTLARTIRLSASEMELFSALRAGTKPRLDSERRCRFKWLTATPPPSLRFRLATTPILYSSPRLQTVPRLRPRRIMYPVPSRKRLTIGGAGLLARIIRGGGEKWLTAQH